MVLYEGLRYKCFLFFSQVLILHTNLEAVFAVFLTDDLLDQLVVGQAFDCPNHVVLLWVHQPSVVEGDVEKVENDALGSVLEVRNTGETDVDVQASLEQLSTVINILMGKKSSSK